MKDKKGQDISITTIILVVLGIAVLVLLILGFTKGWNNILPWLSGNNVDTIRTQCQTACATGSTYGFCTEIKKMKASNETLEKTCAVLAKDYSYYKIDNCSSINC